METDYRQPEQEVKGDADPNRAGVERGTEEEEKDTRERIPFKGRGGINTCLNHRKRMGGGGT